LRIRILFCDVNNTIAQIGKPPTSTTIKELKKLEAKGVLLVLASGRSIEYLKGFSRAIGIHPLFVGDNGSMIHNFEQYEYIRLAGKLKGLTPIKRELKKKYKGHLMFVTQESSHLIEHRYSRKGAKVLASEARKIANGLDLDVRIGISGNNAVYISPKNIDKGIALERIMELYHVKKEEVVAIGNDANDIPVIKKVGLFVGIGKQIKRNKNINNFSTIEQGLRYINSLY